jgi:hypoxanthine-guanine phosphoribosyltransferase
MIQNDYFIHVSKLCNTKRVVIDESCIAKRNNELHITYCENDCLDKFEANVNLLAGSSSFFHSLKKRVSTTLISLISVFVILMAFLSVSIYEDFLKKVIF